MKKQLIIIGGGGHAKVLIDAALSTGLFNLKGIVDPAIKIGQRIMGVPVLGGDEVLERSERTRRSIFLAIGLGSVKASDKRKELYQRFANDYRFPVIVHRMAYVARTAVIEPGVQVMAGAIINPGASVARNSIINTSAVIEHDCRIAGHSHVSVGAILGGDVWVGGSSHIGMGAKIIQGVRIGERVTVGAGSVVTKDVADCSTVVGVPARGIHE